MTKETVKRLERNQECLSILIEGDIIEYVTEERHLMNDREYDHHWAIYMGNSMIMRHDTKRKQIIYESYWKIANEMYIFINKDLDKRLTTLPIYETLYRARNAHMYNKRFNKKFSSDKNFAMWCRFDINKSDIDFATDNGNYSSTAAKGFIIQRFLERIDEAEEFNSKPKSTEKKKNSKSASLMA